VATEHYIIPCECGATVRSQSAEATCDRCGRLLVVEGWGGRPDILTLPVKN
jgi:ribosomal protein S27E